MPMTDVLVMVRDGKIAGVFGVPEGHRVIVLDYDVKNENGVYFQRESNQTLETDGDGEEYFEKIYHHR